MSLGCSAQTARLIASCRPSTFFVECLRPFLVAQSSEQLDMSVLRNARNAPNNLTRIVAHTILHQRTGILQGCSL